MLPNVTTPISCGGISRATIVCAVFMMFAAVISGSTVLCGIAPCPPNPVIFTLNMSAAANTVAWFTPTYPLGVWFHM